MSEKRRLSLMVDLELFERIERARGAGSELAVPREQYVRAVLKRWVGFRQEAERALGEYGESGVSVGSDASVVGESAAKSESPAPAEQPEEPYVFERERQAVRAAVESGAKSVRVEMGSALPREFRPYPKGGKR